MNISSFVLILAFNTSDKYAERDTLGLFITTLPITASVFKKSAYCKQGTVNLCILDLIFY